MEESLFLTQGHMNLIKNFDALWLSLTIWTRALANRISQGVDYTAVMNRLFRVPLDFYNRLQLMFTPEQAEGYANLLSRHIILIHTLLLAQKNNDNQTVQTSSIQLYENADEIAAYLAQINPLWEDAQWRNLLYGYIYLTFEETTAIMLQESEKDIIVFDRIINQAYQMGDYMANGIISYLVATNRPYAS